MSTSNFEISRAPWGNSAGARCGAAESTWWMQHREASLNWLALGLLLAAWNASDDAAVAQAPSRPAELRGYSFVSVRAAASHPWSNARYR
jgi:hypothetical protein